MRSARAVSAGAAGRSFRVVALVTTILEYLNDIADFADADFISATLDIRVRKDEDAGTQSTKHDLYKGPLSYEIQRWFTRTKYLIKTVSSIYN